MSDNLDAIELLDAGRKAVLEKLRDFRELAEDKAPAHRRGALAEQICTDLAIQSRLADEILYPALREALADDDLVDDAESHHAGVRDLLAQVLAARPEEGLFDAKVTVLGDYVARQVRHEREAIFARLRRSGADLRALGRAIAVRRSELRAVPETLREEALASTV